MCFPSREVVAACLDGGRGLVPHVPKKPKTVVWPLRAVAYRADNPRHRSMPAKDGPSRPEKRYSDPQGMRLAAPAGRPEAANLDLRTLTDTRTPKPGLSFPYALPLCDDSDSCCAVRLVEGFTPS